MRMSQVLADRRKMRRYICTRIPADGTKVILAHGCDGEVYADLTPWHDEGSDEWELDIQSNEPDSATLEDVYKHFRFQDMTSQEWHRHFTYVDPVKQFNQKVDSLSPNEREVFDAASDSEPSIGEDLVFKAGHDYNGQMKGILCLLVKLGLLVKVKGGYLRKPVASASSGLNAHRRFAAVSLPIRIR